MIIRTVLCVCTLRIEAVAIGRLFQETRSLREAAGINGAIISDGERVAHVLHGAGDAVLSVVSHIRSDARMDAPLLLTTQDADGPHRPWPLSGWKAGWATPEVLDAMMAVAALPAPDGLAQALQGLLGQCDLL
jgi:hypothetical protein